MAVDLEGIYPVRVSAAALSKAPDEIDHVARGEFLVEWPRPPRVGTKIRIDLAFGEDTPVPLPGLVTWSRPPRAGVTGAFRAKVDGLPALMQDTLARMVETARDRALLRQLNAGAVRKAPIQRESIVERVRIRQPDERAADAPPAPTALSGLLRGSVRTPGSLRPAPAPLPPIENAPTDEPRPARGQSRRPDQASLSLPPLEGPPELDDTPPARSDHHEFAHGTAHLRRDALDFDDSDGGAFELDTGAGRNAVPSIAETSKVPPPPPPLEDLSLEEPSFEGTPASISTKPPAPRTRGSEFIGLDEDDESALAASLSATPVVPAHAPPPPERAPALRPPPLADPDDAAFDLAFDMSPSAPVAPPPSSVAPRPAKSVTKAADPDDAAFDLAFDMTPSAPVAPPPRAIARPEPPPRAPTPPAVQPITPSVAASLRPRSLTHGLDESIFDADESLGPPQGPPALGLTPPPLVAPSESPPVRIGFANLRSFEMHHRLFLSQLRVYCTVAPYPPPGSAVSLVIDFPDGRPAHVGPGVVEAHVAPPQVPARGWVALLLDPDGALEQRIRDAATMNGIG